VPDVPVYAGDGLISGDHITAPAIIEYSGNTIVVHPGQAINLDDHANLVFTFGAAS
jgi:N-methylhydantoinase A/oxoprolinase/acetone carboxylase beta subunit